MMLETFPNHFIGNLGNLVKRCWKAKRLASAYSRALSGFSIIYRRQIVSKGSLRLTDNAVIYALLCSVVVICVCMKYIITFH